MAASVFPITYAKVEDVQATFPAVTSLTTVNSSNIAYYMGRAEGLMNAQLAKNFTVPVTPVPVLTLISTDLTIWELAKRIYSGETLKESAWAVRYAEANSLLAALAAGDIPMATASGTVIVMDKQVMEVYSNSSGYTPTFQEDDWVTQAVDQDKLDDISVSRD